MSNVEIRKGPEAGIIRFCILHFPRVRPRGSMTDARVADLPPEDQPRASHLLQEFRRVTQRPAAFVVRAPGRVNLLGEHTDYNGLPVLPMAIDRSIVAVGAPRDQQTHADRQINLFNTSPQFAPRRYQLTDTIAPYVEGDWGNY